MQEQGSGVGEKLSSGIISLFLWRVLVL